MTDLDTALAELRAASNALRLAGTDANVAREASAWDRYAEICDEVGKCLEPSCNAHSPNRAWCTDHE